MNVRILTCSIALVVLLCAINVSSAATLGYRSKDMGDAVDSMVDMPVVRQANEESSNEDSEEDDEEDDSENQQQSAVQQQLQQQAESQEESEEDDADDDDDDDDSFLRRRRRDADLAALPMAMADAMPMAMADAMPMAMSDAMPMAMTDAMPMAMSDAMPMAIPAELSLQQADNKQPEQTEQLEQAEESETEAAVAESTAGTTAAPPRKPSVLVLIRDALKKVTTELPTEQVTTNALQYFQLFEHFIQQTIEQVIGDDDDDDEAPTAINTELEAILPSIDTDKNTPEVMAAAVASVAEKPETITEAASAVAAESPMPEQPAIVSVAENNI